MLEITLVKAARPGDRDRAYLQSGGTARRGPVHVIHDLPHLVVESLFGIKDLEQCWLAVPPGRALRRAYPLPRDFFARGLQFSEGARTDGAP